MKNDIGLFLNSKGQFDVQFKDGDLKPDNGLETAVILSLFTDVQVTDEEIPFGETSRRGWFGDKYLDIPGDKIGSKLWLLAREKRKVEVLRKTEDYCLQALQWLIDDGVASSVTATASFEGLVSDGKWAVEIKITKPTGQEFSFKAIWNEQRLIRG